MKKNLKDNNRRELKVNELYQVTGGAWLSSARSPNIGDREINYLTGGPSSDFWICPRCEKSIPVKDLKLHISSCTGNN